MSDYILTPDGELYHYGVLGMKWGRRKDRSAGISKRKSKKRQMSDDAREAALIKKKKVSEMSNAELRKLNERKQLERTYASLNQKKSRGKKAFEAFVKTAGTISAATAAYATYKKVGKSILDKLNSVSA